MARTKASVGSKVSSFKSSKARCSAAPPVSNSTGSSSSDRQSKGSSGGNPVCPRETPKWQKPITNFFICKDGETNDYMEAGTSNIKTKKTESSNENNVSELDVENNDLETHNGNHDLQIHNDLEINNHNGNNDLGTDNGNNHLGTDNENNDLEINNDLGVSNDPEISKNGVLDESIELHPLNGENSHKMDEYFNKGSKGKGVGKKSKGKENRRDSKRTREDDIESTNKKVKVDE